MSLWLITTPLLAPFMVLRAGIDDFEEVQQFLWSIWGTYNRIFLMLIIFEMVKHKRKLPHNLAFIIKPWGFLCIFLIVHNLITHFDLSVIYQNAIGALYATTPMLLFLVNKRAIPNLKQLYITVLIVILIQLIWLPLNMQGLFAYMSRYQEIISNADEASLLPGTFARSNGLADYVSIVFLFIMVDFFFRRKMPLWQFVMVSIGVGVLLIFAGSKLPIVCTVIAFLMCLVLYSKRGVLTAIFVLVFSAFIFIYLSDASEMISNNDGVNRIVNGLSSFAKTHKEGKDDNTTFALSERLYQKYFFQAPLMGCGYSYKGQDLAYPTTHIVSDLTTIKADATFAYYLVEFGLIGIGLFLFYYFRVIQYACLSLPHQMSKISLIIFLFFVFFAMTEGGIFNRENYIFIYSYIFALQRYYEEHVCHTAQLAENYATSINRHSNI